MKRTSSCSLAVAVLLAALAACSERAAAPVEPPPLARPQAQANAGSPDTRTLGAGREPGLCAATSQQVLALVNAARAAGGRCGARAFAPSSPVAWNDALFSAAQGHSLDMAKRNYFDHSSPEGSRVRDRVAAVHYSWKFLGENIAGGDRNIDEAVHSWLESPHHCENVLDPQFTDIAVACAQQPGSQYGSYWTMVLGRRR